MDDFYILFCKKSMEIESLYYYNKTRTCLKKAFCKMCVTICGRFRSNEGTVAGYGNRIRVKSPAKWGVQIAGIIFQTRSSQYGGYLIFAVPRYSRIRASFIFSPITITTSWPAEMGLRENSLRVAFNSSQLLSADTF